MIQDRTMQHDDECEDVPASQRAYMKSSPEKIYLVVGDYHDIPPDAPFSELSEVSWCEDPVDSGDISYIREDIVRKREAELVDQIRMLEL